MATADFSNAIFFAILILLIILVGPKVSKYFYPNYENIFSAEGFKALLLLMVIYVSNGEFLFSVLITAIFVVIMCLIREKNEEQNKKLVSNKQECFENGPPVASCSAYDTAQSDFLGVPFYKMTPEDKFSEISNYPSLQPIIDYSKVINNAPEQLKHFYPPALNNITAGYLGDVKY